MNAFSDIPSIQLNELVRQHNSQYRVDLNDPGDGAYPTFGETMKDLVQQVNQEQVTAANNVSDVIEGRSENLHGAMISMTEAKLSFQLLLEIRNRILDAYKDVEKMPM